MKINQIVLSESFWGDMKDAFNIGRKDYIAKRAAEMGMSVQDLAQQTQQHTTPTSVPNVPKPDAPKPTVAPRRNIQVIKKEISSLSKKQQMNIYYDLQNRLF